MIVHEMVRANEVVNPAESRWLPDLLDIRLWWKRGNGPPRSAGKLKTSGSCCPPLPGIRWKHAPLVTECVVGTALYALSAFADARLDLGRKRVKGFTNTINRVRRR